MGTLRPVLGLLKLGRVVGRPEAQARIEGLFVGSTDATGGDLWDANLAHATIQMNGIEKMVESMTHKPHVVPLVWGSRP